MLRDRVKKLETQVEDLKREQEAMYRAFRAFMGYLKADGFETSTFGESDMYDKVLYSNTRINHLKAYKDWFRGRALKDGVIRVIAKSERGRDTALKNRTTFFRNGTEMPVQEVLDLLFDALQIEPRYKAPTHSSHYLIKREAQVEQEDKAEE